MSLCLQREISTMRGKQKSPPTNPVGVWIDENMERRGVQSLRELADLAGVSQARITQIRNGDQTTRDMIERLAAAFVPEDTDEHVGRALLNAGLNAAGFKGVDDFETFDDKPSPHDYARSVIREKGYDDQEFTGEEVDQIASGLNALIGGYIAKKRQERGEID